MLVEGQWTADWQPVQAKDGKGRFIRQESQFRHWITPDGGPGPTGEGGFAAEPDRYHLFVALICPWASRAVMTRILKKLEQVVSISVLDPVLTDYGWRFGPPSGRGETISQGADYLYEIYTRADPRYSGRATVPVLWDKKRGTIVNNESADIVRMFNRSFDAFGDPGVELYPDALAPDIDTLNTRLYDLLNNGVYKAGFASSQEAYEEAARGVFAMLDELEQRLGDGRTFLFGEQLTETDIRAFVTLVRFDAAYHGIFKCNLRRIADYPALSAYTARIYSRPDIAATVNIDHVKRGYYSILALNPLGIIPIGPRRPIPRNEDQV